MASASSFRLDQRISIAGKGIGTIAFIGKTEFADGDWIGIILDAPNGKNNGTVQKKDGTNVRYFTCADNHGLYVRPGQIETIASDAQSNNVPRSNSNQSIKTPTGSTKPSGVTARATGLRPPSGTTSNRSSGIFDDTGLTRSNTQSSNEQISSTTINEKPPPKEEIKEPPPPPSISPVVLPPKIASDENLSKKMMNSPTTDASESSQILLLNSKISDQQEQIETLKKKRRDDLEKLREFDRLKLQIDQFQSDKRAAQARIKELNDKNQQQENELKEIKEKFDNYREEMADTEIRIESLTLDLEMAEERLESLTTENTSLKDKLEETQLELDVIKEEIQLSGPDQVANSFQKKIDDERIIKLEQALIQLRDVSVARKNESDKLKDEMKTLEHNIKILTKENEHAKTEISNMQATIIDLTEQVDTNLGAQEMVDILTTKNLTLEDQVRKLQETADDLESICEMDKEMEEHAREIERELRENLDLLQNQIQDKERQIEQLQYTIGDHERTILRFRESLKNMQYQNEQTQKQIDKYDEQLKLAGSAQSSEFKAKIIETKSYAEMIESQLNKFDVDYYSRYVQLIVCFLPEQFLKRGADHDCLLTYLFVPKLISKCDLLINEIQKQSNRIEQINFDDIVKSHRAEQWSFTCKISLVLSIFRMILRKYQKTMQVCKPETLRQLAISYHDFLPHEKCLDILIEFLQKDQLHDSISLNSLDRTIVFFEHMYKIHLNEQKFPMTNYLRDFIRIVLLSNDALQADIQRIQILQKEVGQVGCDQSPFANLLQRLMQINEQLRAQISKINRLVPAEDDKNRSIDLDNQTISAIELALKHLDRLSKTFHEICSGLTTQILLLSDANERISTDNIESIAYQACDKIYKQEDSGPYDSLLNSMLETLSTLNKLSQSLENGVFDSTVPTEKSKPPIQLLAEQLKNSLNELDSFRARLELKDEELIDMKKLMKSKHDEFSELNIRLTLNDKKIESLQKDLDGKVSKHQTIVEEIRVNFEKQLKQRDDELTDLQTEVDQLQREKNDLKERLKQVTKNTLLKDILPRESTIAAKMSPILNLMTDTQPVASQRIEQTVSSAANEQEINSLRNTIRLLKDELWQMKMQLSSNDLAKLTLPTKPDEKSNEIAQLYKNSTLLLNDLYSTIANYKITGENVQVKQELMRSKMKLANQTAADLNNRLYQCQNTVLPGSAVQTTMKTFSNPQFSKSLTSTRQLAAEIQLPGVSTGGEYDLTPEQYRLIMRETIGCI